MSIVSGAVRAGTGKDIVRGGQSGKSVFLTKGEEGHRLEDHQLHKVVVRETRKGPSIDYRLMLIMESREDLLMWIMSQNRVINALNREREEEEEKEWFGARGERNEKCQ